MGKAKLLDIIKNCTVFVGQNSEDAKEALIKILAAVLFCYDVSGEPRDDAIQSYLDMVETLYSEDR